MYFPVASELCDKKCHATLITSSAAGTSQIIKRAPAHVKTPVVTEKEVCTTINRTLKVTVSFLISGASRNDEHLIMGLRRECLAKIM